ncbi:mannonate dehydratase [Acuticoccus mangrovi]|uniref:Mannonate dehydratase n=1 Tax=Acuticoccus mangrovi TaxID=2796142 RepID=A0A934IQN1_9HYPH|nr:mannonate dehydratase [Acuticoccus mangrovi]MBJ3776280.1 mannonate dehydratase [Acuticoccus mangrovi]
MLHTWRWFGPQDRASLTDVRQAGAVGVVTALHHIPEGVVWSPEEIAKRKAMIETDGGEPTGLTWVVAESLPVSEDIKRQVGDYKAHFAAYRESLGNLAAAGVTVICYNFMPVLDWTRTHLNWRLPHGGTAMRFDLVDFAVFDIHLAARAGAAEAHGAALAQAAEERFAAMSEARKKELAAAITAGLPGSDRTLTLDDVKAAIATYDGVDADRLRRHMADFLAEVVPTAERLGVRLCCHPDDPPVPLLGLPRIVSTEADYRAMLDAVDSPANGVTLCSGSLGARAGNDLPGMMARLGDRVHFLHLRNVRHEPGPGTAPYTSFHESDHLDGEVDMVALVAAVLAEEAKRAAAGRADAVIPMRPDHGHDLADDLKRGAQPGYPTVGRIKGLAELRGVEAALRAVRR